MQDFRVPPPLSPPPRNTSLKWLFIFAGVVLAGFLCVLALVVFFVLKGTGRIAFTEADRARGDVRWIEREIDWKHFYTSDVTYVPRTEYGRAVKNYYLTQIRERGAMDRAYPAIANAMSVNYHVLLSASGNARALKANQTYCDLTLAWRKSTKADLQVVFAATHSTFGPRQAKEDQMALDEGEFQKFTGEYDDTAADELRLMISGRASCDASGYRLIWPNRADQDKYLQLETKLNKLDRRFIELSSKLDRDASTYFER